MKIYRVSELREVEQKILNKKAEITQLEGSVFFYANQDAVLRTIRNEVEELEVKRKFLLDRRESWLPKTFWNLLIPLLVSIVTTLVTLYINSH